MKNKSGEELGLELAKRRTKRLYDWLGVRPVHTVIAYAYMLACMDMIETVKFKEK